MRVVWYVGVYTVQILKYKLVIEIVCVIKSEGCFVYRTKQYRETGRTLDDTRVKIKAGRIKIRWLRKKVHVHRTLSVDNFEQRRGQNPYPAEQPRWGLLRWYSTSSTVQTAPFTFSTRMKHLWSDRLCRTAF